mmetsp:Transcript_712/g.2105  ORF Transcript_712/g.2105 Transcript_712/m.2105 type:complete len:298 (+) Transcript_712:936-1829(+)
MLSCGDAGGSSGCPASSVKCTVGYCGSTPGYLIWPPPEPPLPLPSAGASSSSSTAGPVTTSQSTLWSRAISERRATFFFGSGTLMARASTSLGLTFSFKHVSSLWALCTYSLPYLAWSWVFTAWSSGSWALHRLAAYTTLATLSCMSSGRPLLIFISSTLTLRSSQYSSNISNASTVLSSWIKASTLILAESSFPVASSVAMSFLWALVVIAFLFCSSLILDTHSLSCVLHLFGSKPPPNRDWNISPASRSSASALCYDDDGGGDDVVVDDDDDDDVSLNQTINRNKPNQRQSRFPK